MILRMIIIMIIIIRTLTTMIIIILVIIIIIIKSILRIQNCTLKCVLFIYEFPIFYVVF